MIHPPVKDFDLRYYPDGDVTQLFGENPELYSKAISGLKAHNGLDVVRPWGEPIYCVEGGVVCDVKDDAGGYGKHVRILSPLKTRLHREWTYGHLSKIDVKLEQEIKGGEQIGLTGNTGFVISGATPYWKYNPYAGTHLHLGYRKFVEWNGEGHYTIQYLNQIRGNIENYNNGYFGALDPAHLLHLVAKESHLRKQWLTLRSIVNQILELFNVNK